MLDFKAELDKLLAMETEPLPENELAEVLAAGRELLASFNKKQTDISMQVEEIYDLVREADNAEMRDSLREEKRRAARLVGLIIGLCDILEDFHAYTAQGGDEALARQSLMMWKNSGKILEECGMARVCEPGETGEAFSPDIHTVQAVTPSDCPKEHVARVLRSGYRYMGTVVRKAAVVLSSGTEGFNEQDNRY